MNYYGGLSFLVHVSIIIIRWILKNPRPTLVILTVSTAVFLGAGATIIQSFSTDSNFALVDESLLPCTPLPPSPQGTVGSVILRLDDVQAFLWADISKKIIREALHRDMPLVLAVIPLGLEKDRAIVRFLKRHNCNVEIALHGFDNKDDNGEFWGLSEDEARLKLQKGKAVVDRVAERPVTTFIPPNNVYSTGTGAALLKMGFEIVSSEGDKYFDYTASTFNFPIHLLVPVSEVLTDCREGLHSKGVCVIMIHPQDYATNGYLDEEKYQEYIALLDLLQKENVSFTTMTELLHPRPKEEEEQNDHFHSGFGAVLLTAAFHVLLPSVLH